MSVIFVFTTGIAFSAECTAADKALSDAWSGGINAGHPEWATRNLCSSMYAGQNVRQKEVQQYPHAVVRHNHLDRNQ